MKIIPIKVNSPYSNFKAYPHKQEQNQSKPVCSEKFKKEVINIYKIAIPVFIASVIILKAFIQKRIAKIEAEEAKELNKVLDAQYHVKNLREIIEKVSKT